MQFLERLEKHHFADVPPDVRSNLLRFFSSRPADARPNEHPVPRGVQRQLTRLRAASPAR